MTRDQYTLRPWSDFEHASLLLELLGSISERIAILSSEGLLLDINQRPLTDARVQREEVVGKPFTQFPSWSSAGPVAREQLRAAIAQSSRGECVHFEARICPHAGQSLDLAVTLTPHCDRNQQVEYLIYTARDITERKRVEEELRTLVDVIPQHVWIAGPDGGVTYINQRFRYAMKWVRLCHLK